MANIKQNLESFKCDLCERKFAYKKDMQLHIDTVHGGKKDYTCDVCGMNFTQNPARNLHKRLVHKKVEKKHKCDFCAKTYFYKNELTNHIFVHHDGKRFQCDECDVSFGSRRGLQLHRKTVHLKISNYKCRFCGKLCTQKSNLKTHIKAVHLKERNHKCDKCNKTYKTSQLELFSP